MTTIKSYTDLSQSKKLAEILPLESADICYMYLGTEDKKYQDIPICALAMEGDLCAWSLAALLDVLPYPHIEQNYKGKWTCRVELGNTTYLWEDSNPIDACVAMVKKLNELNLL